MPSATLPESLFTVTPLERQADQKFNFGAIVEGIDLNDVSDDELKQLKDSIWTHKLVIVKNQKDLDPKTNWELVTRFDPDAHQVHSHGDVKSFNTKGGMLTVGASGGSLRPT
jgi:alpha-ketoglutarate-dependent taurine dioxygenase